MKQHRLFTKTDVNIHKQHRFLLKMMLTYNLALVLPKTDVNLQTLTSVIYKTDVNLQTDINVYINIDFNTKPMLTFVN